MPPSRSLDTLDVSTNILWPTISEEAIYPPKGEVPSSGITCIGNGDLEESRLLINAVGKNNDQGSTKKGVNWVLTAFLMVNTALGIGLLNIPAAYNQAGGILAGTLIQLVLVILMMSTILILAYCSDFNGDVTYHAVLLTMCGRKAQQLSAVSIAVTLYCVCVAVFIIIGDQMDSLLLVAVGPKFCSYWYFERSFTITCIAILLILPFCYCKRVDFLGYLGPIGIFAMLYPVFLCVYIYYASGVHAEDIKTRPDDTTSMIAVIPVLALGFQCQEVVVPVYACMKKRNLWDFTKATTLGMSLLFAIYSIMGSIGYSTFGTGVAHNVMKMFDAKDPVVMVGVGALILKMIVTYPLLGLCGRDAVTGLYAELAKLTTREVQAREKIHRFVVASIWFASSLMLALSASSIGIVIKYLGCVASANIFIFPGICLMRMVMMKDPDYLKRKSFLFLSYSIFIIGFGVFCGVVILIQTIMDHSSEVANRTCV